VLPEVDQEQSARELLEHALKFPALHAIFKRESTCLVPAKVRNSTSATW